MRRPGKDIDTHIEPGRPVTSLLERLREAGEPIVLTINGSAELPVHDAGSLQRLLELVERLETIDGIRRGMKDLADGRGLSLEEFKEEVRIKHGIPL